MTAQLTINCRFHFSAGHRLYGHEGPCAHIHGHNYEAEVQLQGTNDLDAVGRIIDFAQVKDLVGQWIDENWDHHLLLWCRDPLADLYSWPQEQQGEIAPGLRDLTFNPTAENMATELLDVCASLLYKLPVQVASVTIWETADCWARATWPE